MSKFRNSSENINDLKFPSRLDKLLNIHDGDRKFKIESLGSNFKGPILTWELSGVELTGALRQVKRMTANFFKKFL